MTAGQEEEPAGLFDVGELAPRANAGRVEAGLQRALQEAAEARIIGPSDAGLAAGALVAARSLDLAETIHNPKDRAYAVTALLPPFQRALHGLRLPAEVTPVTEAPADVPAGMGAGGPQSLGDFFGTPT